MKDSVEMAFGNIQQNNRLEKEHKRLERNIYLGRLEEFPLNELNARWLRARAILVSSPIIHPRSYSFALGE